MGAAQAHSASERAKAKRMADTDYGTTFAALPGQPPDEMFRPISGRRVLAESIARQLTCPPGGLFWAPDKGIDLRAYLRARLDSSALTQIRARILATLQLDERIVDAEATVTFRSSDRVLSIKLAIESAEGPFSFVLDVATARVEVFAFSEL